MKYIQKFADHSNFRNKKAAYNNLVALCDLESHIHYGQDSDYANECFSIKILSGEDATIELHYDSNLGPISVYVATVPVSCDSVEGTIDYHAPDGTTYKEIEGSNGVISITGLNSGDQLWFYQLENWNIWSETVDDETVYHGAIEFNMTGCTVSLQGNLMSLIAKNDADLVTASQNFTQTYLFCKTFKGQPVVYANNLVLPLLKLTNYIYNQMFHGCSQLKTIPKLPATTLASSCYFSMFYQCTALEDISYLKLPARVLYPNCYRSMFNGCTALRYPVKEIVGRTYNGNSDSYSMYYMFYNTAITKIPRLYLGRVGKYGCSFMFGNCYNLVDASDFSFANRDAYPSDTEPYAWTYAFHRMFSDCSNLTKIFDEFPRNSPRCYGSSSTRHFNYMFYGCSSLERAPKINVRTILNSQFYHCFDECHKLNYFDAGAVIDHSATSCTGAWLRKVASSGTFIQNQTINPAWSSGVDGIPSGWTVITVDDDGNPVTI